MTWTLYVRYRSGYETTHVLGSKLAAERLAHHSKWRAAADVILETHYEGIGFGELTGHLYEISKAPRETSPAATTSAGGRSPKETHRDHVAGRRRHRSQPRRSGRHHLADLAAE